MKPIVKLSEIAENIEIASDEAEAFYNELTGEFYYYNQYFTDDERDLDEEEGWLRLPNQRDADEYGMMSDFADTISKPRVRERLEIALTGKGAFRRFKDAVNREGVAEAWYAFRDRRYLEFARDWCDEEEVPYDKNELPKDPESFSASPLKSKVNGGQADKMYEPLMQANERSKAESDAFNAKLAAPMDIDEYIEAQSLPVQSILRRVRDAIRTAAPGAVEKISWQMPTFWRGQNLIHFAAQKKHIGIYPGVEAMEYFTPRLSKYKTSKGAIQFPYQDFGDEQLLLIAEIAAWRAEYSAK
jgi:uncharacterized protein YdhG (YjbR/CyaY superfamily)